MTLKKCKWCGGEISTDEKLCPNCGKVQDWKVSELDRIELLIDGTVIGRSYRWTEIKRWGIVLKEEEAEETLPDKTLHLTKEEFDMIRGLPDIRYFQCQVGNETFTPRYVILKKRVAPGEKGAYGESVINPSFYTYEVNIYFEHNGPR
ncbi:MAG: hypothetical protein P9X24_12910 [Candidatus Hatepunaea meridiana]|nr:hypothetical protein [Candidatus Hatepunaea meridiana]